MAIRRMLLSSVIIAWLIMTSNWVGATDAREVLGVSFPGQIEINGETLYLNGVAYRKALGFIKVYAVGLYLEKTSNDATEVIESEQIKHMITHYLTDRATAVKLREGFLDLIQECNPKEMVMAHRDAIDTYASWLDKDMAPGLTSISTYIPGKGLTLVYQGEEKGTIAGSEFAQMYYRYNVGEKADRRIRNGLLNR